MTRLAGRASSMRLSPDNFPFRSVSFPAALRCCLRLIRRILRCMAMVAIMLERGVLSTREGCARWAARWAVGEVSKHGTRPLAAGALPAYSGVMTRRTLRHEA